MHAQARCHQQRPALDFSLKIYQAVVRLTDRYEQGLTASSW